jgi:hypothetical protein
MSIEIDAKIDAFRSAINVFIKLIRLLPSEYQDEVDFDSFSYYEKSILISHGIIWVEKQKKEEELLPCIFCENNTMIIDGTCNGSFWAICPTCYYITPSQYCKHQLCMEKTCLNESKIRAVMNHNELYRKLHPEQKNQIGQTEIAEKLKYAAHKWYRYLQEKKKPSNNCQCSRCW